jgi:hypothetical protein
MGLRPTHGYESALLRFIDSKQVTRGFRGGAIALRQLYLLQLRVFGFGSFENWDVWISVRPRGKEGLVFLAGAVDVCRTAISACKTQMRNTRYGESGRPNWWFPAFRKLLPKPLEPLKSARALPLQNRPRE